MKGMLHRLFKEQSIPLENVNKLRKLGDVVSGNGTVDYVIVLSGQDGFMEYYNYSLVGTDVEEVGEGYFVLNDVEVRHFGGWDSDSPIKNYYKGKSFDYSMEYEKPLNSLEFFYEMVYGRAGEMFLKPPYSKYLGFDAEGGTQLKDKKYNYLIGSINRTLDNYFNTPQKERIMSQSAHNTIVDIRRQIAMSQLTLEERMKMDERDSLDSYESEGGEQYDYYTIERDYDEGYMNARVPTLKTNRLFDPLYYTQYMMMNDMSDRISTAFHPNAEVREQSGYGTREKQRDAIFNGLKSWNEQMIEDLNGVKRSIDMELGDRKFEAETETFEARYKNDGTIAYTEIEWFGGYSRTGGNNWGAIPLGNFGRERYFFIDGKIVMTSPEVRSLKNEYNVKAIRDLRDDESDRHFQSMATATQKQRAKQLIMKVFREYDRNTQFRRGAEEFEAEESINPKDYIAISFLDQQGNGHPTTLLNTYDLRFGERGSTYFKALREALDKGVKRGDYDGYKIKKTTSKPLMDADFDYETPYNNEYGYQVWLMGDKFFYGDSDIPVVKKNKYTINEGEPKFADMVYLNVIPKEKTEQPMDGLGSLFGAERFALEDGQRIPNLTNHEWKEVSRALGKVGTFHDWEHGGTDGEGGGGTTLIVNKENGVFGYRDEYKCSSCGYMYNPSLFEGFDKHTPLSWCEYCRNEEEEELEAKYGAENFEAKGIDTFTEPFAELRTGSILNKAILLGSLGAGAMIGLKLRK